jgi:hypothetical protein
MESRTIAIIGGGFAGTTRALEGRLPPGYELLLISEESHTTFTPVLPEVVGAGVFPEQIVGSPPAAPHSGNARGITNMTLRKQMSIDGNTAWPRRGRSIAQQSRPQLHLQLACIAHFSGRRVYGLWERTTGRAARRADISERFRASVERRLAREVDSWSRRRVGYRRRRRNEPIAAAGHGFYKARLPRMVVEHHPHLTDGGLQHRVAEELVAPNVVE